MYIRKLLNSYLNSHEFFESFRLISFCLVCRRPYSTYAWISFIFIFGFSLPSDFFLFTLITWLLTFLSFQPDRFSFFILPYSCSILPYLSFLECRLSSKKFRHFHHDQRSPCYLPALPSAWCILDTFCPSRYALEVLLLSCNLYICFSSLDFLCLYSSYGCA